VTGATIAIEALPILIAEETMFELTQDEQEYVESVLKSAHTELLRNLHHADCRDFRQALRSVIEMNERITGKVNGMGPAILDAVEWNQPSAGH
jgi:hypothetical protein